MECCTNFRCEVSHPDTEVFLSGQQSIAAVVQPPAHWRVRVRHHLPVQLVHHCHGRLVVSEVDEAISSGLIGELDCHHL